MNNDEIKALLRELKERSDQNGEVKSQTVRINFGEDEPEKPAKQKKKKSRRSFWKKETAPEETAPVPEEQQEEAAEDLEPSGEPSSSGTEVKAGLQKKASFSSERSKTTEEPELPENVSAGGRTETEEKTEEKAAEKAAQPGEKITVFPGKKQDKAVKPKPARRKLPGERSFFGNMKLGLQEYFADLKSKGIAGKELLMIGTVIVLAVLIIVIVVNMVRGTNGQSENVTADEGLTVTVRQQPEVWCSQGLVALDIRAREDIQSVTINGTVYAPENGSRAEISLETDSSLLDITVVVQDGTLTAQVKVPMVDSQAPQVTLSQENGTVTLTATDDNSGLEGIYYGTTVGLGDVPFYQKYTGPFQYEEGRTYYYYARDNAGNRSEPVATTMEAATALALDQTQLTLFPGESVQLSASAIPSGGYFNSPKWESSDPAVASVDDDGNVTALQEGETQIQISAEGIAPAVCQVQVRQEAQVTISALGDCTLGTDVNFNTTTSFDAYQQMYGDSYFFENVRSILSEDDITFANFEGTLTTLDTRADKQFAFKGDPSYTDILIDGSIDSVTLANNHSSDYGAQSLTDTEEYLTQAGIDYCTGDNIIVKEVNGVTVGLIGIYVLDEGVAKAEQVERTIAQAREQGAQIVVVAFHWGSELAESPDETQISLAHTAIDSGADLVVGHHPHVLQGIEVYQGKYIAYSLGNFCFGGNSSPSDMDTMIFQQTFSVTADGAVSDGEIQIIPCSISSQSGVNNYQPTPATGQEAERIMAKINERSAQFGQSF